MLVFLSNPASHAEREREREAFPPEWHGFETGTSTCAVEYRIG
jgi:hypothetical protein